MSKLFSFFGALRVGDENTPRDSVFPVCGGDDEYLKILKAQKVDISTYFYFKYIAKHKCSNYNGSVTSTSNYSVGDIPCEVAKTETINDSLKDNLENKDTIFDSICLGKDSFWQAIAKRSVNVTDDTSPPANASITSTKDRNCNGDYYYEGNPPVRKRLPCVNKGDPGCDPDTSFYDYKLPDTQIELSFRIGDPIYIYPDTLEIVYEIIIGAPFQFAIKGCGEDYYEASSCNVTQNSVLIFNNKWPSYIYGLGCPELPDKINANMSLAWTAYAKKELI